MELKEVTKEAYEYIVHRRRPITYLSLISAKIVGDIGCGSGQNCISLKKMKKEVICVDFALKQLIESRKRGCDNLVLADMEYLPFRDSSFEGLIYIASLHHLKDPSLAIKEGERVLKSKGEILATVWLVQLKFLFRRNVLIVSKVGDKTVKRFVHFYLPRELKRYMEVIGGFKTIKYSLYRVESFLPNNALYYGRKD